MALAVDATSKGYNSDAGTTLTVPHTCSGSNRVLVVTAACQKETSVTGITYNGVAMTLVNSYLTSTYNKLYSYILVAPATGTHDIVLTVANGGKFRGLIAASYTGAAQSGQPDANNTNHTPSATSLTTSVTTVADNSWLILGGFNENYDIAAGTDTTVRETLFGNFKLFDSNGAKSPPGSYSLQTTVSPADEIIHVMLSIAPYVAPAAGKSQGIII